MKTNRRKTKITVSVCLNFDDVAVLLDICDDNKLRKRFAPGGKRNDGRMFFVPQIRIARTPSHIRREQSPAQRKIWVGGYAVSPMPQRAAERRASQQDRNGHAARIRAVKGNAGTALDERRIYACVSRELHLR